MKRKKGRMTGKGMREWWRGRVGSMYFVNIDIQQIKYDLALNYKAYISLRYSNNLFILVDRDVYNSLSPGSFEL